MFLPTSIIVADTPTSAYYTAVLKWRWQCDRRTIPEFQTKEGVVVYYLKEGYLKRILDRAGKHSVDVNVYLGQGWEKRSDAKFIMDCIEQDRLKLVEMDKK